MKKTHFIVLFASIFMLFLSLIPGDTLQSIYENKQLDTANTDSSQFYPRVNNSSIILWNRTYGGPNDDCAYSIAIDSDHGYVLAGYTYSIGSGDSDAWLVKTDAFGNMLWNKTYGGLKHDEAHSITRIPSGGFIIAGVTNSFGFGYFDAWLIRIDSNGNMLWSRTYGGAGNEELWSVIVTSDGGFAAAGWTTSFGAGAGDFWLIKTDASGNVEWNKTYGGKNFEAATCLKQTQDGGFVLVGYTYSYGAGGSDIWLIKTDKYGNAQWNMTYGGSNEDYGFCVTQTTDGGYAIAGSTSSFGAGVYDFWLIKTNGLGQPVWNKTYGGPGYDEAWCITQVSEDSLVIAGWTESFGSGGSDCWFIAVDLQGQILWHQTWGGEKNDYAYSLACELDGVFLLCGQTQSLGVGGSDFLLLKFWEVSNKLSFGGSRMPLLK